MKIDKLFYLILFAGMASTSFSSTFEKEYNTELKADEVIEATYPETLEENKWFAKLRSEIYGFKYFSDLTELCIDKFIEENQNNLQQPCSEIGDIAISLENDNQLKIKGKSHLDEAINTVRVRFAKSDSSTLKREHNQAVYDKISEIIEIVREQADEKNSLQFTVDAAPSEEYTISSLAWKDYKSQLDFNNSVRHALEIKALHKLLDANQTPITNEFWDRFLSIHNDHEDSESKISQKELDLYGFLYRVKFIEYKKENAVFFDLFKKIMEEESIDSFEPLDTYINKINPAFSNFSLFQSFIEKTRFYDEHRGIGAYDWNNMCNPMELNHNLEQVTLRRFVSLDAENVNQKLDIGSISFLGLKNEENKYIMYNLCLIGCAPPESIAVLSAYAHKMISFIESNKEDPRLKEFCAQCYWAQMIAQAGIYNEKKNHEKKNHEKMLNDEMLNDNIDMYGKGLSEFFSHKYGLTFGPNFVHRMPFVMTLQAFVSYFVENVTP